MPRKVIAQGEVKLNPVFMNIIKESPVRAKDM